VDFLAIGHVTRDLLEDDLNGPYTLGGTVSFASVTASRLGRRAAILTRAGADVDLSPLHDHASLWVLPSRATTTFANRYTPQGRVQHVYTPADAITAADLPDSLHSPRIALLGPLVGEVAADLAEAFSPQTLLAAVPQGWMRAWDEDGLIRPIPWQDAHQVLRHTHVLILSIEDINGDLGEIDRFLQSVPLVIMTQYREGCTVYQRQADGRVEQVQVPPRPATEIDPTGAGDIFATAFLLWLAETGDALQAARYGNITASFGVEGVGLATIPTHAAVLAYMAEHPWNPEL
jgi:sugar/nucleoside kinase (ribokinase family)